MMKSGLNDLPCDLSRSNGRTQTQGQGDYPKAQKYYERALEVAREIGEQRGLARTLSKLGVILSNQGDIGGARQLYNESLQISKLKGQERSTLRPLFPLRLFDLDTEPRQMHLLAPKRDHRVHFCSSASRDVTSKQRDGA